MPNMLVRQASFAGGELAPYMYGRTDAAVYAAGARRVRNFLPVSHGGLQNRPGTKFVCAVKDSTKAVRLVPFVFADGQTFVLEFGDLYVRFVTNGGQVLSGGAPYEVATPYALADLPRLTFAQAGDVITIAHPSYQPRELQRIANTNWQLALASFTPQGWFAGTPSIALNKQAFGSVAKWSTPPLGIGYPLGTYVQYQPGGAGAWKVYVNTVAGNQNPPDVAGWTDLSWNAGTTYGRGEYVWDNGLPFMSLNDNNKGNSTNTAAWWVVATDSTHLAKPWQWRITQLWRDSLGVVRETQPATVSNVATTTAVYSDRPVTIEWAAPGGAAFSYQMVGYNVYRGRNGLFGWVGAADAGATSFVDEGAEPDFSLQPPKSTNPFVVADGAGSASTNSWPGLVAYHQQRRVFARSNAKPQDFWASYVSDLARFDVNTPARDSDAYNWKLASLQLEELRAIVPLTDLVLMTGHGEWTASGGQGGPITSSSIDVRRHSQHGSSYLQPLVVGNTVLFNTAKGNYVRDLVYDYRTASRDGGDLTTHARHLFEGRTLVDWAFAGVPYSMAWAVRDDGSLLSLTYDRAAGVAGWAQHTTVGSYEVVCSVPEGTEDAVYVVVRRTVNGTTVRYIERMASRYVPDVNQGVFLDCALTYSGAVTTTIGGLGHLEGASVTVLANGNVGANPYTVRGGQIDLSGEFPDGVTTAVVGLPYVSELELLDLAHSSIKTNVKGVLSVSFEVVGSRGILAGEDFAHVKAARSRDVADNYDAAGLVTGTVDVAISGTWNQGGRAVLRQSAPLPLTVVAVIREVEVGGR